MHGKDGGPAFPRPATVGDPGGAPYIECVEQDGMSLLDYFAGQALKGMLGRVPILDDINMPAWAEKAYDFGAAMVAEKHTRERKSSDV